MSVSKMSTYEHMINALLYPVGTRGYGTDTRVLVLLNDSTLVCPSNWGMKGRGPPYSCNRVQLYICMYMYAGYMVHVNVKLN